MDEELVSAIPGCLGCLGCVALLIWFITMVDKKKCPQCEHLVRMQEIGTQLIPGTKERIEHEIDPYYGPDARPRRYESRLYAEYRVFYGCPDCGYEWEKIDKREVPGAEVKYRTW